jgi:hypothetical protein
MNIGKGLSVGARSLVTWTKTKKKAVIAIWLGDYKTPLFLRTLNWLSCILWRLSGTAFKRGEPKSWSGLVSYGARVGAAAVVPNVRDDTSSSSATCSEQARCSDTGRIWGLWCKEQTRYR